MKATLKKVRNHLHYHLVRKNWLCKRITTGLPLDVIKTPFGYSYEGSWDDPVSAGIIMMSAYRWGLEDGAKYWKAVAEWEATRTAVDESAPVPF